MEIYGIMIQWGALIVVIFIVVSAFSIEMLGRFKYYRLQASIANITFVAPVNVILASMFILLTPVRGFYYRWLNMKEPTLTPFPAQSDGPYPEPKAIPSVVSVSH